MRIDKKFIFIALAVIILVSLISSFISSVKNSGEEYIIENAKFVDSIVFDEYSTSVFGVFEEFDGTQHKLYMHEDKVGELTKGNKYNVVYVMKYKLAPHDYILREVIPTGAKRVEDVK